MIDVTYKKDKSLRVAIIRTYDVIRISTREIADTPFETIEKIREYLQSNIL